MTLTSEELRTSWVWKHKRLALLVCLLIWVVSGFVGYSLPSLLFVPLAFVNMVPIFLLLRLAQLYHAPKNWKEQTKD